jgi:D-alanyl-D-alanine carboxypeptidase/D-alanyl-D-alanine-endopeptidase (penicillin-binding protein 4)
VRKRLVAALAGVVLVGGVGAAAVLRDEGVRALDPLPLPSPYPTRTALLLPPDEAPVPTPAGLQRALAAVLRDKGLGRRVSLSVVDVTTSRTLLAVEAGREVTPASTAKIATAVAVLTVLPAEQRFRTTVLAGARPGEVVLVGGGDASLDGDDLRSLASQVKKAGTTVTRVLVDDTLFTGPSMGPGWKPGYVEHGNVAPVSALAVDEGRTSDREGSPRVSDPALAAGKQLARLLGFGAVARGVAPAGAARVATVASQPLSVLVEDMLTRSDNDLAEALGRHTALASKLPATFDGVAAAIAATLKGLGVDVGLRDASGLSPLDRLRPSSVTALLTKAATDPRYAPVLSGLPVAGFDGTLADRYRTGPTRVAAGEVRAKTGTLNGVSALAGLVVTRDGRLLAFDLTADGVALGATVAAQKALDRVATALASCGCP